ncbi:SDR family oxidoreductase [Rubrivirga litoralis]|uniref:SDR family oxidoreductase n=1 Tax=Rubrivirga litoralis TaxID=3075598 RepID=A0ABU3BMD1_9BACT|nr:SDR family oxidoreductase [Rubrivirga sp. F394]MDT0630444.1 SDR family oxidoreductase [Rubrivirga sp. F394]
MSVSLKPLDQQTLVITGASSGIGLATALEAASRGADLFLVARAPEDLNEAAERCRALGADVETMAADVADRAVLDLIVQTATERFGGFDTWINNAGVSIYGEIKDVPEESARQLFETNYWGTVHGSLVAAEHFRTRRGTGGAIINVGSVLGDRAIPLQGHYSASKHAVKGFTDAFRMELEKEGLAVSVTLIKPNATGTPYTEHAANYMDREAALPTPAYAPETVARAILSAAERPVRDVTVGAKDGALTVLGTIAPRLTDKLMEASFFDQQKGDAPYTGDRSGTLQEPVPGSGRVHGAVDGHVFQSSPWAQLQAHPLASAGLALGAALALTLGLRRN